MYVCIYIYTFYLLSTWSLPFVDIKPGNAANQRLGVSNDSMSSVEEFASNEGSSRSELGSAASIDRMQVFDRNAPVMKYEGLVSVVKYYFVNTFM